MSIGKKAVMVKYTKPKLANGDMLQYFAVHPEKLREKRLRDAKKKHAMVFFADEMGKIAASTSFMQNVGNKLTSWGKSLASTPRRTAQAVGDIVESPSGALRHGWNETWGPKVGFGGKAMFVGGTALQAADLARDGDITGRGESRMTRGMRLVGGTIAGTAGMKRGILPSIALGIGGDVAAGAVGRKIDKARGYKPKPKAGAISDHAPSKAAIAHKALES
jgi:hypothetical protein